MIITLSGKITLRNENFVIVDVRGVGYQVFLSNTSFQVVQKDTDVMLWIHEHIREDSHDLYGFLSQIEHCLFRTLLSISGVGPKLAMNILTLGSAKEIETMIEKGDIVWLTRVPGVGKKTAQKIILELKGKLVGVDEGILGSDDVLTALVNLGYNRERARDALSRVPATTADVEDRLRIAMKELGR